MPACFPVQLVLLPGLGTDRRLFVPQAAEFDGLMVPPWIEPRRRESLPDYAARMAEALSPRPACPLVLGGVSLGGMIAYEMARHLEPDALVLIATCRTREGLARYRPLAPLARRLPLAAVSMAQRISPIAAGWFSACPVEIGRSVIEMFREADSRLVRWALAALLDWQPSALPKSLIFQIHGRLDRVIPARRVQADQVISTGGHLINLTHPAEVNRFIARALKTVKIPTV